MEQRPLGVNTNMRENNMDSSYKFGMLLASLRKHFKKSVEELAKELNIIPQELSSWEEGLTFPSKAKLQNIMKVFKIQDSKQARLVEILNASKDARGLQEFSDKNSPKAEKKPKPKIDPDAFYPAGVNRR